MASESEQGHVDCTVKRRTRLVRITFVGSSVQSLTNSNRRIRNRTYGGVGGADERLSPLSRSRVSAPRGLLVISEHEPQRELQVAAVGCRGVLAKGAVSLHARGIERGGSVHRGE